MKVHVHDIDLYWEEHGEGVPLLWLHGGMGFGADWRHVFPEAPGGYRLIAPDLRAHGASAGDSATFSFRQCALDVLALLRHRDIARVKAIGVSGGGIVLLHMATIDPGRVQAMVVVSAPPYFPAEARTIMRQYSAAMIPDAEMTRMRQRHARGDAQIQDLLTMTRALAESYDDVSFTPPKLATITARTLIVFGDRDPLYPVSLAFELQRGIPNAHLWVVPNGGHGPVFGAAAPAFREAALAFLPG
jgi:pimeloyl-ACP methyl ester carboxylesterase